MRLIMNLLIKNEVDIIAANIRTHAALGVDGFVVMDNGSTDGTREVVASLQADYDIHIIDNPDLDYQQSNWKTQMARLARNKMGANWSIANDADEFWIPQGHADLKAHLSKTGSVLLCPRRNVLFEQPAFTQQSPFYEQTSVVMHPVVYPKGLEGKTEQMSIMLGKIHGKVMVNTLGLLRVKGGNHRAWHLWGALNKQSCDDIVVYHYPLRSPERFIENIKNRQQLLAKGITKMGGHYKRWVRLYEQGKIEEELQRLVPSPEMMQHLKQLGIVVEDHRARDLIKGS